MPTSRKGEVVLSEQVFDELAAATEDVLRYGASGDFNRLRRALALAKDDIQDGREYAKEQARENPEWNRP